MSISDFHRYAVYHLPDDRDLAEFGASWLGWDVVAGTPRAQPLVSGVAEITATPRRYGFHGTLKPPFRMARGRRLEELEASVALIAAQSPPIVLDGLALAHIGSFIALVPAGDTSLLDGFAFKCVTELDRFRCPPDAVEIGRRRQGLTRRQDALLAQWGYPYVAEEFRFHLTLSGRLEAAQAERIQADLAILLPPLPRPFRIASISLLGADRHGMFHQIHRYALTG